MLDTLHRIVKEVNAAADLEKALSTIVDANVTTLFAALGDAEIERYVALDDPVDCAGSYKLESRGLWLVDELDGRRLFMRADFNVPLDSDGNVVHNLQDSEGRDFSKSTSAEQFGDSLYIGSLTEPKWGRFDLSTLK